MKRPLHISAYILDTREPNFIAIIKLQPCDSSLGIREPVKWVGETRIDNN